MSKISSEMDALLTHAEQNGLCLWQCDVSDKADFSDQWADGWEDCLWDPCELRQALIDYPGQPRAGIAYSGHSYPYDITEHTRWRLVNPRDMYSKFDEEAQAAREYADFFKGIWIDKTIDKSWKKS